MLLVDEVFRVNGAFLAAGNVLGSAASLSAAKLQVLGHVRRGPVSVAALARARGLSRQSVQETANRLLADGLVERRENPADRRAPILDLTDRGRRAFRATAPHRAAWAEETAAAVDPADLRTAILVLQSLRRTLSGD